MHRATAEWTLDLSRINSRIRTCIMIASSTLMLEMHQTRLAQGTTDGINGAVRRSTHSRKAKPKEKEPRAKVIKAKAKAINQAKEKAASRDHATGAVNLDTVNGTAQ